MVCACARARVRAMSLRVCVCMRGRAGVRACARVRACLFEGGWVCGCMCGCVRVVCACASVHAGACSDSSYTAFFNANVSLGMQFIVLAFYLCSYVVVVNWTLLQITVAILLNSFLSAHRHKIGICLPSPRLSTYLHAICG